MYFYVSHRVDEKQNAFKPSGGLQLIKYLSHVRQVISRPRIEAETLILIPMLGTGHCSSHEFPCSLSWTMRGCECTGAAGAYIPYPREKEWNRTGTEYHT